LTKSIHPLPQLMATPISASQWLETLAYHENPKSFHSRQCLAYESISKTHPLPNTTTPSLLCVGIQQPQDELPGNEEILSHAE
jgi:hypothetical protein